MNFFNYKKIFFSQFLIIVSASFSAATAQSPVSVKTPEPQNSAQAVRREFYAGKTVNPSREAASSPDLPPHSVRKTEATAINPPKVDANALRHLSLENAIDLLTQNNLSVIAARYNVNLAQAQRLVAALRPPATVTVSATQFKFPSSFLHPQTFITGANPSNSAANISYTAEYDRLIERGGKRNLRISQAEYNSRAAETLVKDALRQQIFQLKQAFLTALLARENLRVALDNYRTFDASRTILNAQVKEGYAAGVDLKRIDLQKLQFQRDLSVAEQNFQQSTRDIYNLIGVGDSFSVVDDLTNVNFEDSSFVPQMKADLEILVGNLDFEPVLLSISDLREATLENRPDIKNAELNLEAARAGLKLAEAQQLRDITVGGQFSRVGGDNTFGVVATIPLGIKKRAELAQGQAQINVRLAESNLRQVQTQALTDVEKAFTAYMTSRSRLRLFTNQALIKANDVREIEEISYRDGAKGLLDYLDAQRVYNQTMIDYNQSRFDFLSSLTQLEAAVGTKLPVK